MALIKPDRPNKLDIVVFFRQFATLIEAGIPLIQACDILEKSQAKLSLQRLIYEIKKELLAGNPLSFCFAKYPAFFDRLICQLIKTGETTGKLDDMLSIIALKLEKKHAFSLKIKQTLFYPSLVLIFALLITAGMIIFIIPKFAELFQHSHSKLPWLTASLFCFANSLNDHLSWIGLILLSLFIILYRYKNKFIKKEIILNKITKIPWVNHYWRNFLLARFTRNLAITFASGLPILDGLKLAMEGEYQGEFMRMTGLLYHRIKAGQSFNEAMMTLSYFPPILKNMLKIGEETGKMDTILHKVADIIEAEIDIQLQRASQLLEPLIMAILGVLIGGLVITMYLPIFNLGNTI